MVVVLSESTQRHNVLFKFLSLYPHQDRRLKGNKGAPQEEDHWITSALKKGTSSLWLIHIHFPFTIYNMSMRYGL